MSGRYRQRPAGKRQAASDLVHDPFAHQAESLALYNLSQIIESVVDFSQLGRRLDRFCRERRSVGCSVIGSPFIVAAGGGCFQRRARKIPGALLSRGRANQRHAGCREISYLNDETGISDGCHEQCRPGAELLGGEVRPAISHPGLIQALSGIYPESVSSKGRRRAIHAARKVGWNAQKNQGCSNTKLSTTLREDRSGHPGDHCPGDHCAVGGQHERCPGGFSIRLIT